MEIRKFWMSPSVSDQGRSWFPPEKGAILFATLVTDASKYQWGGHLHFEVNRTQYSSDLGFSYEAQGPSTSTTS